MDEITHRRVTTAMTAMMIMMTMMTTVAVVVMIVLMVLMVKKQLQQKHQQQPAYDNWYDLEKYVKLFNMPHQPCYFRVCFSFFFLSNSVGKDQESKSSSFVIVHAFNTVHSFFSFPYSII